ncbi:MAG: hypothetical protein RI101_12955 [Nitrospira sp.]|jgi:ribosomal protein S27AE|nr:hypothetical protein [Nitrospira sp.]
MATASTQQGNGNHLQHRAVSLAGHPESMCVRCGGFMVSDLCMDLLNSTGELAFAAKRCVQCGEVVDPVIVRNRRVRLESRTVRSQGTLDQSREWQVRS